ncbi:MAG: PAS domain-containing sensor histidine kinase [Desulfobacteraceae bacterium]|nr:MAG: PAS domain-containing sensor histidine kinase [Desulfobacteraceae bacterium]
MFKKFINSKFWAGVPPWVFIGSVMVLFPIFAFMTIQSIHRTSLQNTSLLVEKGAALIRSFEAGTRTGMSGNFMGSFHLQRLLSETAMQPDIAYILVTDAEGTIVAHNHPDYVGEIYETGMNLKWISGAKEVRWRVVAMPDDIKIFEVYRSFVPVSGMHRGGVMRRWFNPEYDIKNPRQEDLIIFVGLDMSAVEEARIADMKHSVIMGIVLLLIGFAGIALLFMAQSYKSAKASLLRIKAFSDHLVEKMPIGLIAVDKNKKIALSNNTAGSILALSSPDISGKGADEILPAALWKIISALEDRKGIIETEIECLLNDGKAVPLEVSATELKDETGNFLGYIILFKDLSEVRSLRREVARSQRLASLGSLAAGVAHEIRNPLSSIKGFAVYFSERQKKEEDKQIAAIMIQEVDRLNRVVSQLVELARPVSVSKMPVSLRTIIENSLKLMERDASEKKIEINTSFTTEELEIPIDGDRISQVLLNLYLNAIEAMGKGGRLTVEFSRGEGGAIIKVSDTGSGIGEKDLPHVFDPYFTTKTTGTGLGLSIVHNIIEAHDGKITVESRPGEGTAFTIILPGAKQG